MGMKTYKFRQLSGFQIQTPVIGELNLPDNAKFHKTGHNNWCIIIPEPVRWEILKTYMISGCHLVLPYVCFEHTFIFLNGIADDNWNDDADELLNEFFKDKYIGRYHVYPSNDTLVEIFKLRELHVNKAFVVTRVILDPDYASIDLHELHMMYIDENMGNILSLQDNCVYKIIDKQTFDVNFQKTINILK